MNDGKDKLTFGDYPPELLRFFEEREHAEEFISGNIRIGSLDYYKGVEDQTINDPSEGTGLFIAPSEGLGYIYNIATYASPMYILSFTDPRRANIAKLKEKFGKQHVVRITNPIELGQKLTDTFCKLDPTHPFADMVVECCKVRYDENQRRDTEPTLSEIYELSTRQKPSKFSEEYEFRLIVPTALHKFEKNKEGKRIFCDHYYFDLGGPLNCAQILDEKT